LLKKQLEEERKIKEEIKAGPEPFEIVTIEDE
jgi:hypothetical protein